MGDDFGGGPAPGWGQPYPPAYRPAYPPAYAPAYPGGAPFPYPYPVGHLPRWGAPWDPHRKPGVIPLRPLSLTDIFNGAVGYVRANPAASLGLTTVIVVITSIVQLGADTARPALGGEGAEVGALLTAVFGTALATILLSGMLTVVVARSVSGVPITVSEAWRRVRGRLVSLVAMSLLEIVAVVALIGTTVLVIAGVAKASSGAVAAVVGLPSVILAASGIAYLLTVLSFAPVAIVLERKSVTEAIRRSVALARRHFWRILGIRALASVVAVLIAGAVTVPFGIVSALASAGQESAVAAVLAAVIAAVGRAVGQIITAPFTAGVTVLLYVDARIRSEAFDIVLQTGAGVLQTGAGGPYGGSPDDLWLTADR